MLIRRGFIRHCGSHPPVGILLQDTCYPFRITWAYLEAEVLTILADSYASENTGLDLLQFNQLDAMKCCFLWVSAFPINSDATSEQGMATAFPTDISEAIDIVAVPTLWFLLWLYSSPQHKAIREL